MSNTLSLSGTVNLTLTGTHGSRSVSDVFSIPSSQFAVSEISRSVEVNAVIPPASTYVCSLDPGATSILYLAFVTDVPVEVRINSATADAFTKVSSVYVVVYDEDATTKVFVKNPSTAQASISGWAGGR